MIFEIIFTNYYYNRMKKGDKIQIGENKEVEELHRPTKTQESSITLLKALALSN